MFREWIGRAYTGGESSLLPHQPRRDGDCTPHATADAPLAPLGSPETREQRRIRAARAYVGAPSAPLITITGATGGAVTRTIGAPPDHERELVTRIPGPLGVIVRTPRPPSDPETENGRRAHHRAAEQHRRKVRAAVDAALSAPGMRPTPTPAIKRAPNARAAVAAAEYEQACLLGVETIGGHPRLERHGAAPRHAPRVSHDPSPVIPRMAAGEWFARLYRANDVLRGALVIDSRARSAARSRHHDHVTRERTPLAQSREPVTAAMAALVLAAEQASADGKSPVSAARGAWRDVPRRPRAVREPSAA
jgi:hypothetical protein